MNSPITNSPAQQFTNSPIRQLTNSPTAAILFDGVCNLCNGFVQFVIERDPAVRFQFGALESDGARRLLASAGCESPIPGSVVLIEDGRLFTRSTAALRIARHLQFPWPLVYGFMLVPRPVRDAIYDWIARRRYRWFGQRDQCLAPTAEHRLRFLD